MTISTLLAVLMLTGCGIRLESAAPPELVPDSNEIARQAMVSDSLAIKDEALAALGTVAPDSAAAQTLSDIAVRADAHVAALGGVYVSGTSSTPDADPSDDAVSADGPTSLDPGSVTGTDGELDPSAATGTPSAPATAAPAAPSVETVLALLTQSATRARTSLETPTDPSLARLFSSITTAELDSAWRLAADSSLDTALPEGFTTDLPQALPLNLAAADLTTLVRSEDAAGYAYEVMAARMSDETRARALARAQVHRDRAQEWAELASLDGTATDPRQVAYTLPDAADGTSVLLDPQAMADLAAQLENTLAASYATFAGQVDPENRTSMLDLLVDSRRAALTWGAPLVTFPGMPEQS